MVLSDALSVVCPFYIGETVHHIRPLDERDHHSPYSQISLNEKHFMRHLFSLWGVWINSAPPHKEEEEQEASHSFCLPHLPFSIGTSRGHGVGGCIYRNNDNDND